MVQIILSIIISSTIAAFLITLATKWHIIEYVQVHGNKLFSQMFSCWFCLSFWVNVIITIVLIILTHNFELAFLPVICTPITKKLL